MKNPKYLISVDWIQVFCHCVLEDDPFDLLPRIPANLQSDWQDECGHHYTYTLHDPSVYTAGYEWCRDVYADNTLVAYLSAIPKASLGRDVTGCSIRIANSILYLANWSFFLHDILHVLQWDAVNISRCDLCIDLNYFAGGLHPETFIRQYVSRKKTSAIRHGSNKFVCYGIKEMHDLHMSSIRWGNRQSGVSVYLYNKSLELKTQKFKPYIVDAWKKAELAYKGKDVWRVEISITSASLGLKDIKTHLVHTLFTDELTTQEAVENIFFSYASTYFRFLRLNPNVHRKKDLKDFPLLPTPEKTPTLKPTTLPATSNSSSRDWRAFKYLQEFRASPLCNCRAELDSILQSLESLLSLRTQIDKDFHSALCIDEDSFLKSLRADYERLLQTKQLLHHNRRTLEEALIQHRIDNLMHVFQSSTSAAAETIKS